MGEGGRKGKRERERSLAVSVSPWTTAQKH